MSDAIEEYRGKHLVLRFEGHRCIHARRCVLGAPGVFKANVAGPWIDPDALPADELAALARECPSGAITYERVDGGAAETAPPVNVVRVRENGPLAFHGDLRIAGQACLRATLCRCGQSRSKPYCDRSHADAHFAASGEAATRVCPPLDERAGPLTIDPSTDGPLLVRGNLEVVTGTGRMILRAPATAKPIAFCRCGQSHDKPFCDGSHKAVGFRSI